MCGIVGALSLNNPCINVNYAKPMADKIAHRGPDDAGYLFFIQVRGIVRKSLLSEFNRYSVC